MKSYLPLAVTLVTFSQVVFAQERLTLWDFWVRIWQLEEENDTQQEQIDSLYQELSGQHYARYAGFTSQTVPEVTRVSLNAACKSDFGPGARLATTDEFIAAGVSSPAGGSQDFAWIESLNYVQRSDGNLIDISGSVSTSGVNCEGWLPNNGRAFVVRGSDMSLHSFSCNNVSTPRFAACSVPASN